MIPNQLKKELGIKYLLVNRKAKIPLEDNWQKQNNYNADDPKLIQHLESGNNYGVLCGNGLIVMDADTPEFDKLILDNFPETFSVRTSKGKHYYFFTIGFDRKKVLKKDGLHLGEIQSKGAFVVGANSIHPNGTKYEVENDIEIQSVEKDLIDNIFGSYYAADKISKDIILNGSGEGIRNETMFKLACGFRQKEMTAEETHITLRSINEKNNPPLSDVELISVIKSAYTYPNTVQNDNLPAIKVDVKAIIKQWHDYFDLARQIWAVKPFFYDEQGMWWEWQSKDCYWKMSDEINLFNFVDDCINQSFTVKSKFKSELLETLKRLGRRNQPKEAPKKWVQFKKKAYSLNSGNVYDVTPDYFFCNPIPWELGKTDHTPTMDSMFKQWVGEEYMQTLYEIIAYCCYTNYPIHRIFAFIGSGCNGKSTFQTLLRNFIGADNVTATELDVLLDSRFESAKVYKKLCCVMGETNFGVMSKTSLLKKLSGQDLIGFEWKNKKPFEGENYAKLIINSNSMPTSGDTSEGFYRRWMIIDFPNKFKEGRDILKDIPESEYNSLALKVTKILPKLLENGTFSNEGDIAERQRRYVEASNPLKIFLDQYTIEDVEDYIRSSELYKFYVQYLRAHKKRIVSKIEFRRTLEFEGLEVRRTTKNTISDNYIEGIRLKTQIMDFERDKNSM